VLGSAVNPVLREGNSDRRVAASVKAYAKSHPHSMGTWSRDSRSHVSSMSGGDFYGSEQSAVIGAAGKVAIEFVDAATGGSSVLKEVAVDAGDVIGASAMSRRALQEFFAASIADAKAKGVLLSLHLKATMMKVSDPIMFGHAVTTYYKDVFDKHARRVRDARRRSRQRHRRRLRQDPGAAGRPEGGDRSRPAGRLRRPAAAGDGGFEQGITNLHVPSDVIIDASMPAAIRASGQMWGPDGKLHDMKAMIPDRCYAGIYQATIDDCRAHGAFDVPTMGTCRTSGLDGAGGRRSTARTTRRSRSPSRARCA
jgi:isocitrate dehydrogenase